MRYSWQPILGLGTELRTSGIRSARRPTDFSAAILALACSNLYSEILVLASAHILYLDAHITTLCRFLMLHISPNYANFGGRGAYYCITTFQKQHSGKHKRITQHVGAECLISLAITDLPQSSVIRLQYNSNFANQNLWTEWKQLYI